MIPALYLADLLSGNFDILNKLLDAIEDLENVEAIFSVNKLVIETLNYQRKIPEYIHMFTRVPWLKVLQYADLFVTHGCLGSVKENIYYGVPMLVYPLDLHYDHKGNYTITWDTSAGYM